MGIGEIRLEAESDGDRRGYGTREGDAGMKGDRVWRGMGRRGYRNGSRSRVKIC